MIMKYVYIVRGGGNHYKVGVAQNVKKRLRGLQTSNANPIELVTAKLVEDASKVERELHGALRLMTAKNGGREWFVLKPDQVVDLAVRLNALPEIDIADYVYESLRKQVRGIVDSYAELVAEQVRLAKLPPPKQLEPEAQKPRPAPTSRQEYNENFDADVEIAKNIIVEHGSASTSLLQRRMRIGYGRAARIIDQLEQSGLVSKADGYHPREVLIA